MGIGVFSSVGNNKWLRPTTRRNPGRAFAVVSIAAFASNR
jgi:hypothetical protein